ncbi:MAG: hypothetical protein IIW49_09815, partial [Treponema sp.]|nr:hypothetical protein [Treponema sp.]
MKKIINFIFAISLVAGLFIGCNNSVTLSDDECSQITNSRAALPDAPDTIEDGYIRINFKGNADNIWIWNDFDSAEVAKCVNWNTDKLPFESKNGDFVSIDLKLAENSKSLGMIPRKGTNKLVPGDCFFNFPMRYNEIFIKEKDSTVYVDSSCTKQAEGLLSAKFTSGTEITINGSVKLSNETVTLKDKDRNIVSNIDYSTDNTTITLDDVAATYAQKCPYTLSVETSFGTDTVTVGLDSNLLEEWFAEEAKKVNDLGVTFNGASATFKVWAPLASDVKLLVYDDVEKVGNFKPATVAAKSSGSTDEVELYGEPSIDPIAMTIDPVTGVWSYELSNYSAYKYYKYQIVNNGTTYYVCDIYAKAASPDSIAAQLVDINAGTTYGTKENYVNPFGNSGETQKSYADAVIYEMHIRDWAKAFDGEGKFIELAESEKFIAHLKEMGITHVQVVPMFDYAQVNSDKNYNWGYNPYHYNVPEGRYVKDMKDGMDAVNQLRQFIKALHDAGIAINMDVVYNHTNGTQGGSLYDSTVPEYYYRLNNGSYTNGSGCGNETDSEKVMFKKYIIESLKHWMLDYHINGFRFDLMGLHKSETMEEIYNELCKIDSNVMVYGEPWTGDGNKKRCNGAVKSDTNLMGAGAFDDDFRNAIKGGEFGGFQHGHVQGTYKDSAIVAGLKGSSCTRNKTGTPALALHYVECHDNYTLFDKLAMSYLKKTTFAGDLFAAIEAEGLKAVKAQNKLAAAYVFLAQGTPFMNGGQEFLRTKRGDENSYSSNDTINAIDLSFATKYADVVATYKGLIALRKDFSAFRYAKTAKAETVSEGVTKYDVTADDGNFTVLFNATDKSASVSEVK